MLVHPMMRFLREHEKDFDAKDFDNGKQYYASNFVYVKTNGQSFSGDVAVKQLVEDYALFKEHFHEPIYVVITETEDGYCLLGHAKLYVNLPVPGEKKYEDLQGRKWECLALGAYKFNVVKDDTGVQGLRFTSFQTFADPTPILSEAIKRKVIPVEALTGGA